MTVFNPPPPASVDFKVPKFSYKIHPSSNLLFVLLSLTIVAPIGDGIEYHLWVGLRELSPSDQDSNFITLNQVSI